ncbi:phosphatase PAP2 family protein [Wenzhouxiangella sp. XN79A]|nr:phosphatase PAP2 family protein [Wenzhouxiangella sp. XN79A]
MPFSNAAQRGLARVDQLEQRLCLTLNRASTRASVRSFFAAVSRVGDGMVWYALMTVLAATQGMYGVRAALVMGLSSLIGVGLYKVLKERLVRERPYLTHHAIRVGCAPLDRYSFPSGHTLHAVLFTTIAIAWFPALAAVLIPLAVLIALSRVVLGLHYPTDVVFGALIGWGLAELALWGFPPAT